MSDYRWVRVESEDTGVRTLTLDKPPVNALGREMVDELTRASRKLAADGDGRCLILRSAGQHFCGGADLKERRTMSVEDVRRFVPQLAGACNALAAIPYPTIAAIAGAAAGGGCEMALACDLRILADNSKIGLRETALAILPGGGGTQRLPRLIGPARAKRWIFLAEMHDAAQALADQVADRVVPVEQLDALARDWASRIAANGPVAVRLAKRAVDEGAHLSLADALEFEWQCYQPTLDTTDRAEALDAFAAKRPPRFRGC
jgi:methylglutaconyl-CoA hydratase